MEKCGRKTGHARAPNISHLRCSSCSILEMLLRPENTVGMSPTSCCPSMWSLLDSQTVLQDHGLTLGLGGRNRKSLGSGVPGVSVYNIICLTPTDPCTPIPSAYIARAILVPKMIDSLFQKYIQNNKLNHTNQYAIQINRVCSRSRHRQIHIYIHSYIFNQVWKIPPLIRSCLQLEGIFFSVLHYFMQ